MDLETLLKNFVLKGGRLGEQPVVHVSVFWRHRAEMVAVGGHAAKVGRPPLRFRSEHSLSSFLSKTKRAFVIEDLEPDRGVYAPYSFHVERSRGTIVVEMNTENNLSQEVKSAVRLGMLVSAASKMLPRTLDAATAAIDADPSAPQEAVRELQEVLRTSRLRADERAGLVLRGIPRTSSFVDWDTWATAFNRADNITTLVDVSEVVFERLHVVRVSIDRAVAILGDRPMATALGHVRRMSGRPLAED